MYGGPPRKRLAVEDLPQLDIHRLRRQGIIRPGATYAALEVAGFGHTRIPLAVRPGTLGGEVFLFRCPRCDASRWHLYLLAGEIGCRGCFRLVWVRAARFGTATASRVRRLRRRLGVSEAPLSPLSLPTRLSKRAKILVAELAQAEGRLLGDLGALTMRMSNPKDRKRDRHKQPRRRNRQQQRHRPA
jgi:hypothetical protein